MGGLECGWSNLPKKLKKKIPSQNPVTKSMLCQHLLAKNCKNLETISTG
jgi:hypothetical protein